MGVKDPTMEAYWKYCKKGEIACNLYILLYQ